MARQSKTKTVTNYRDADSGQFTTKKFAEENPSTTVKERNKRHTQPSPKPGPKAGSGKRKPSK